MLTQIDQNTSCVFKPNKILLRHPQRLHSLTFV